MFICLRPPRAEPIPPPPPRYTLYEYIPQFFCLLQYIFFLYIIVCDFSQEFVACQDDRDPGVLILSPFAGAGGLMQEALQVSPPSQLVGLHSSHYQS